MDTHAHLTRLADLEELRALKALYALHTDECHGAPSPAAAARAADLFTEDAILDIGAAGRYVGRAAIRDAYENIFPKVTAWSAHHMTNPLLSVDGATATGRWLFVCYLQPRTTPPSPVMALHGHYDEKYEKTAAGWKFKEVKGTITMTSPSPSPPAT